MCVFSEMRGAQNRHGSVRETLKRRGVCVCVRAHSLQLPASVYQCTDCSSISPSTPSLSPSNHRDGRCTAEEKQSTNPCLDKRLVL